MGLLWPSYQSDAETSTWQHIHTRKTDIRAPRGIRTRNPNKGATADQSLLPRRHWGRDLTYLAKANFYSLITCNIKLSAWQEKKFFLHLFVAHFFNRNLKWTRKWTRWDFLWPDSIHFSWRTYEGWNFNSGNYLFTTDTK